jgi:methyl-accepting chemotaxis protein
MKELIGDLARATHQQIHGVGRVGQVVRELDRTTPQNVAFVAPSAAAAASLRQQAESLAQASACEQLTASA